MQDHSDSDLPTSSYPPSKRPRLQEPDITDTDTSDMNTMPTSSSGVSSSIGTIITSPESRRSGSPTADSTRLHLLHQIERIFTSITTSLTSPTGPHPLTIYLTPCPRRPTTTPTVTAISFPASAHRFTCILKILSHIHTSLLHSHPPTTKRDLFYQHPALFRTQTTVDRILADLSATFRVPQQALNIVAGCKGLAYGDFTAGGRSYAASGGGIIVPGGTGDVDVGRGVEWVLVVEKEAVFRGLAVGGEVGGWKGVVVTGKGYPDVATRELVVGLAASGRQVFALVDMDPYGFEIMATYKFGSGALAHERHRLAVEGIEWVGVKTGDLEEVLRGGREVEGVMVLTERDRRKAVSMLGREWMEKVPEWRNEIQKMLVLNVKVEIEILDNATLKQWIEKKILEKMNG